MPEITAHHGIFRDTKLHVDDSGGPGRPVVLIHGWPLSSEAWMQQTQVLADVGYRVITYDRRGFGRSDKPKLATYTYNALADDLEMLLTALDVSSATLVGFSMGGGEVARVLARHGSGRVRSVVFAASVTPYMLQTPDNPDGPLTATAAASTAASLTANEEAFYDDFMTRFFSANGQPAVTERQRQEALALCRQADKHAALQCMAAFGSTDFRDDLTRVDVPTLVLHGDADQTVPFPGSGQLTHRAIPRSDLVTIHGAPHGCNVSHPGEFNQALLEFLAH